MSKKQMMERIEDLEADRDNLARRVCDLEARPQMLPYYPTLPYWTPMVYNGFGTKPLPSGLTTSCTPT